MTDERGRRNDVSKTVIFASAGCFAAILIVDFYLWYFKSSRTSTATLLLIFSVYFSGNALLGLVTGTLDVTFATYTKKAKNPQAFWFGFSLFMSGGFAFCYWMTSM